MARDSLETILVDSFSSLRMLAYKGDGNLWRARGSEFLQIQNLTRRSSTNFRFSSEVFARMAMCKGN